jgi:hypothetical protein
MAVPAYQISQKSTDRFKSYKWGTRTNIHTCIQTDRQTNRQAGNLISPLSFFESRLIEITNRPGVAYFLQVRLSGSRKLETPNRPLNLTLSERLTSQRDVKNLTND